MKTKNPTGTGWKEKQGGIKILLTNIEIAEVMPWNRMCIQEKTQKDCSYISIKYRMRSITEILLSYSAKTCGPCGSQNAKRLQKIDYIYFLFQVSIVSFQVSYLAGYCAPKLHLFHKSEMNNLTEFDALLWSSWAISFILILDVCIKFDGLVYEVQKVLLGLECKTQVKSKYPFP